VDSRLCCSSFAEAEGKELGRPIGREEEKRGGGSGEKEKKRGKARDTAAWMCGIWSSERAGGSSEEGRGRRCGPTEREKKEGLVSLARKGCRLTFAIYRLGEEFWDITGRKERRLAEFGEGERRCH